MLGNSYAGGMTTRQHHPKLKIGSKPKPKPKGRSLAFLREGNDNGTQRYKELTAPNIYAVTRGVAGENNSTEILVRLVHGEKLNVEWRNEHGAFNEGPGKVHRYKVWLA